jgi:acetoin:2,6-dichlorophenolindophenol oxidoreductase subunit alpha
VKSLKGKDPLPALRNHLLKDGCGEAAIKAAEERAKEEVEAAIAFARESPYPAPEEALTQVFV